LRQELPGLSGIAVAHQPPPGQDFPEVEDEQSSRFLFAVGEPTGITPAEWEKFFTILKKYLYGDLMISVELDEWRSKALPKRFGIFAKARFQAFALGSAGQFQSTYVADQPRLLLWWPIRRPGPPTGAEPGGARVPPREIFRRTWQSLLGGLIFLVDGRPWLEAGPMAGFPHAVRNLAREGCRLALLSEGAGRPVCHPDFQRDPELHALIRRPGRPGVQVGDRWVMMEGRLAVGGESRLVVARPRPGLPPEQRRWLALGLAGAGWWLGLGLAAWGHAVWLRRPLGFPIRQQLLAGFAFLLLPALGMGAIVLEKHLLEKQTRFEADLRSRLESRLTAFDDGLQLYRSWGCRTLADRFGSASFTAAVRELEATRRPGDPELTRGFLRRAHRAAFQWGIHVRNLQLTSRGRFQMQYFPSIDQEAASRMGETIAGLYQAGLRRYGRASSGGEEPAANSSAAGHELAVAGQEFKGEEVRNFLRVLMPPDMVTDMLLTPMGFHDLGAGQGVSITAHFVLGFPHHPDYLLSINLLSHLFERSHLLAWEPPVPSLAAVPGELGQPFVTIWESPACALIHPFIEANLRGSQTRMTDFCDVRRLFTLLDLPLADHLCRAAQVGGPSAAILGAGEAARLVVAMPGRAFLGRLLVAQVPLGPFREEQRRFAWLVRGLLALALLWTLLLALLVARRIEAPVARLVAAAQRIMAGDFATPLLEPRADEFGRLAQAFNLMREGVAQGRRLSRLVSDSVRESVRTATPDAGQATAVEAVVLFAGPAGFRERLRRHAPREVVADLNSLLEMMAQAVRDHGGEVNKFIGERVLAVFPRAGPKGQERAAEAAVATAAVLRRRIRTLPAWRATPLGIGLVQGPVLAGILGAERVRLEYTVIGDTVNLASRLCDLALAQPAGGIILEAVLAGELRRLGAEPWTSRARRLPDLLVKGKSRTIQAYRLDEPDGA
jgi:class 3 adenylate cyclase